MRKVWLLGLVAVAVLVVGPMMAACAEEGAPTPKHERKAATTGEVKPEGRKPELVVDPAKLELMKDQVAALDTAIKALEAKAVDVLGPLDGKRFLMQAITKAVRPAGKGENRKERKSGEGRQAGGDDAPK
jgi:hypothetical protein